MKRWAVALVATVAIAAVATAPARAVTVQLRVEAAGTPSPLFSGPVTTQPHLVDGGDGTGAHSCAGSAGGTPSATATGALDDAMRAAGISWRGNWDPDFRDFFIERIGAYASRAPDDYWSLTVDNHYAPGGCLAALAEGDEVRFFYGPLFGEQPGAEGGAPSGAGAGTGPAPGAGGGSTAPGAGTESAPTHPGRLAAKAARYLRRHQESAGELWSALALAAHDGTVSRSHHAKAAGGEFGRGLREPIVTAAKALLNGRLASLRADGSLDEDVNATALAAIALRHQAPSRAARAVGWLVRAQSPSGGFGFRHGVAPDVDTTGLVTWALARAHRTAAAHRDALFVASAQSEDGGFPSIPGGESNAQSTGLALVALRAGRLGVERRSASGATPLAYLAALARPDGSIPYATGSDPTPVWSTAQALLGLLPRSKLMRP